MNGKRMPKAEVGVVIGIIVFAALAFLPWTHHSSLAGVSLIAWLLWVLMIAAPVAGLTVTLRDKTE